MKNHKLNRRNFLRNTSLGFLGAGLLGKKGLATQSQDQENELHKIKGYRRLGRTGAMVSDIGSGVPYNESVLRATLKAGVNFIETSEGYGNGRNEELIGRVIKNFNREKVYIATKASPAYNIFKSTDDIIRRAEASLERLQTKYIDLYMIHQAQNIVRIKNDYFHRACDQLKNEGKIRHVGLSCHGQPYWQEP
ncbi:MAG: aldo/keto reductase, partial [Bacteroidales bacterium]|nr:aldo/keto reductase [Bacteroidales bacterium]